MTVRRRCTTAVVPSALLFLLLAGAPSATALPPGCDWNTDTGTQACLGGGPFDAGKNGNGDTYGPSGEAGFLYDVRLVARSFQALNDEQLVGTGQFVCQQLRDGQSEDSVRKYLVGQLGKRGISEGDVGYMVIDAQMYLCPGSR